MPQRASEVKELLEDLGPTFVKLAQVWASRPDILPKPYQERLTELLEQVQPFGRDGAMETLRRNIKGAKTVESMFDDMSVFESPVAAASIGQVYKAKVNGREVAVKVQRPDVREIVTLDLYVIRRLAGWGSKLPIERYARQFQSLFELIDKVAPPFIEELDYELEAANQRLFAEKIYGCDIVSDAVVVPEVIFSSREVLVQEWLNGKKLTEPGAAREQAGRVVKALINSYMVQFLEFGFLHGDPHPGNFVLTPEGKIGILDYGLMTEIKEQYRLAFVEYIMHVQAKKYDECLQDLINLDFVPEGFGNDPEAKRVIGPGLASTLEILFSQSDLRVQQEKFKEQRDELEASGKLEVLREELTALAKKYGSFRLPSYATLIIRALATLEGVGLQTNEGFSIGQETFPYVARRLLTDDRLRIRSALRDYLYRGRQRIAVTRIDDLVTAFGTFTNLMKGDRSVAAEDGGAPKPFEAEPDGSEAGVRVDAASRDIAAVLFAPEGNYLQELLIDEGVAAVDAMSRAAVVQLIRSLGPLAFPISAPLGFLLGTSSTEKELLTREDKESLLLVRRILQLAQSPLGANLSSAPQVTDGRFLEGLNRARPYVDELLPTIAPGAASFADRFTRAVGSRLLLRVAADVESAGVPKALLAAAA